MIRQYKLRFYNFKLVALLLAISLFGVQLDPEFPVDHVWL